MDRSTWWLLLKSSSIWSGGRIFWPRRGGCCGRRGCCWYRLRTKRITRRRAALRDANPYHVREFEYGEFEAALQGGVSARQAVDAESFGRDRVQSRTRRVSAGDFDAPGDDRPEQAHFFLAACSQSPIGDARAFAWSPVSGNVLRERERHIALLESELAKKDEWLRQAQAAHAALQESHEQLLAELERSNEWAGRLNAELTQAGSGDRGPATGTRDDSVPDMRRRCASWRRNWPCAWTGCAIDRSGSLSNGRNGRSLCRLNWRSPKRSYAWPQIRSGCGWEGDFNLGPEIVTGSGQPE